MKTSTVRAGSLLALALSLSCDTSVRDPERRDRAPGAPAALYLEFPQVGGRNQEAGTPEHPVPFSSDPVELVVRIEALDASSQVMAGFDGWIELSITPGELRSIVGANSTEVAGRGVHLVNGIGDVRVAFARSYGETRILAEESGYVPRDPSTTVAQCADGLDNDMDGRTDFPADYGCAAPNDDTEVGGSYVQGTSPPIYVASPRIYDVQGGAASTPLIDQRVSISAGRLIITRISVAGLWVTDTTEPTQCGDPNPDPAFPNRKYPCYNSIFAFNFRLPDGLRPCDRITYIQGTVQEFVSTTQFSQPSWVVAPDGYFFPDAGVCEIPDPISVGPVALTDPDNLLEPYESSLVRISNVTLSHNVGPDHPTCSRVGTVFQCNFAPGRSNCDLNDDGRVDFHDDGESTCANTCQTTPDCGEWINWRRFGQLAVDFTSGQGPGVQRIIVSPKDAIPNLDPVNPPVPPGTALTVTGTLKQVGPNWIVEPRCTQDLALHPQDVMSARDVCVFPRPPPEE